MLAKSKLSGIETLVSRALIEKYEKMKDNLRSENGKYKIMRLSSLKSKT